MDMKKKKISLFEKVMKNEKFKQKYEHEKKFFEIEYQLEKIMEEIEKFIKDHPPELTEEQYNKLIKDWADDLIKKLEGENEQ